MTLAETLQAVQLLAILGGFTATLAVGRNDTKWIIKSLEDHKADDVRRFQGLQEQIRDLD